ncbi:MAG TPA: preprotein translocase subunit SecG [Anaerohalosphaeraceae bacterium]|mgnify:FL=1|nr:preprotein translocase subunit SecG [Anaerohalosphaeraceae bacterium]HOL88173.1 preprotein translocase subunit SecG [Anaerohalosphaeraceae bacterium]HPP56032.1 preprotein translocase subunit SecG [Anaerohalosphaeraceae bacterium]
MVMTLAMMSFLMNVLMVLFILVALLLILIILIQKGKGGGLGAMFGGMGASSLLGSKTGDVLTWITIGLVSLFLVLGVLLDKTLKSQVREQPSVPPASSAPSSGPETPAAEAPATSEQPAAPAAPAAETPAPAAPAASEAAQPSSQTPPAQNP